MATSFKGWLSSWLNSWGQQAPTDPNAMQGTARITFGATGDATAAGGVLFADMLGTASMSFTATGQLLQPATQTAAQGAGPAITSRNSDSSAYDPERVKDRLKFIEVAGKRFDLLDDSAMQAIESHALDLPDTDDEMARQEAKLAKSFVVATEGTAVEVPVFRPMLDDLPDLKTALLSDIRAYADKVREGIEEERRRVVLLLLDW